MGEGEVQPSDTTEFVRGLTVIRKRPSMYIWSTGPRGIEHLVQEVVANSLDPFLAGHATEIRVHLGDTLIVEDDGAGLPFDRNVAGGEQNLAEWLLTHIHTTKSADGHAPHVHLASQGVGVAVVNALSARFTVQSWRGGRMWEQGFVQGVPEGPAVVTQSDGRGTRIEFEPDPVIFGSAVPSVERLRAILWDACHLFPGVQIGVNREVFYTPVGLADLAPILVGADTHYPDFQRNIRVDHPSFQLDIAMLGKSAGETSWYSWANGVRTWEHGTHVSAICAALAKARVNPRVALVHVIMREPEYAGPSHGRLNTPGLAQRIQTAVEVELHAPVSQAEPHARRP